MKKDFDNWALQYERDVFASDMKNQFPFIGYKNVIKSIVDNATATEGDLILDLGVGTGIISKFFYDKKCQIFGLDFSDQMILLAKEKIPNGHFAVTDLSRDYLDGFSEIIFDTIVSGYCFHHFTDEFKISFIKKLYQYNLKENGKIIIGDIAFCSTEELDTARKKYDKYWDNNEYYICGNYMVEEFKKSNLNTEYIKISPCAGLLIISKVNS